MKWLKLETSKKLLWIVTTLFIINLIFTNVAYILWDKDTTFIFQYVFYAFNVCLIAYTGKAGFENVQKINVSELFKSKFNNLSTDINNQEGGV
jgi:hypothetical protein